MGNFDIKPFVIKIMINGIEPPNEDLSGLSSTNIKRQNSILIWTLFVQCTMIAKIWWSKKFPYEVSNKKVKDKDLLSFFYIELEQPFKCECG